MVEDGFQEAWDDEAQDWWMPLFGMAPCQALMSLYTVNRWPTSPECVSVLTLSFWLSPSSLSSLLHLFCRPLLHLYTLKTLSTRPGKNSKHILLHKNSWVTFSRNRQSSLQLFAVSAWEKETMSQQMLLLMVVSMWLFAGYFLAEATNYNHQMYNRYRALNHHTSMDNQLPPEAPVVTEAVVPHPVNFSRKFYGIMFDAGSTGTRIHIYKFIQKDPGKSLLHCFLHIKWALQFPRWLTCSSCS